MPSSKNLRGYSIGEVSRLSGVNIETIRYYERIGILPEPDRTPGGNRQFSHEQLKRLAFIRHSRDLGFTIEEIRGLLAMVDSRGVSCADVHARTTLHLQNVREKIATLQKLETALSEMATECTRGDIPDCPIIDRLFEVA